MNVTERIPLYQLIQDYIRGRIESEDLKTGDRIPTEKELMERFRVSKITVVNALSGLAQENIINRVPGRGSFVNERRHETRNARVAAAVPTAPAGRKAVRKGTIGLVMPNISDYFAVRLVEGIERELNERGYRCMILLSGGEVEKEKAAIQTLKEIGAEGLLIFPVDEEHYNEEIIAMKFAGFPFVLMDRYLPGVETDYIAADGRKGTRLAVECLWDLGHREIAICSDSPLQTITVQERIEGYTEALKDKGALINPAHIITGFRVESLSQAQTHPLYRYIRNRMATAYISLNGRLAVQIYHMARKAGFSIPEDLSIISFDDPTSIEEEFSFFTHVKQFEFDIGKRAAGQLIEIVEGGNQRIAKYNKTLLEPELVIRQTIGPPRN